MTTALDIPGTIRAGVAHHQAGRLAEAERLYRKILNAYPDHADALHLLGVVAHQSGNNVTAVELIRRATEVNSNEPTYHNNYGEARRALGQIDRAIDCYKNALKLNPGFVEAHNNLGIALDSQGKLDEAIAQYYQALALQPGYIKAHKNLGISYQKQGKLEDAIACYTRALEIAPDYAEAHQNLGCAYQEQNRLDKALDCFKRALAINPQSADAHNNMGTVLREMGQSAQAAAAFEQALTINPESAEAHNNLASVLLYDLGKTAEAIEHFRKALSLNPDYIEANSNLLLALSYSEEYSPQSIFSEHLDFSRRHAEPLSPLIQPHLNDQTCDRRLKIGYVSGDFRSHSVFHFIEPVLALHDHAEFDIYCYYNRGIRDEVTLRLQALAGHWRIIRGISDKDAARQIRKDEIDILVDLSGHTSYNRLLLFAQKPAPVQVTWLGYPNTTGLNTVDYRITDGYADPVGLTDQLYSERLVRLPECFSCFRAPESCPDVSGLPLLRNGYPTFGSLNNPVKITSEVTRVWSEILKALPGSKLLLRLTGKGNDALRHKLYKNFSAQGIGQERVILLDATGPQREHLLRYHEIDIALDTFPYNGTTTNCDALWMGVPVITLAGQTHVSRVGVSQLSNLGLTSLIAGTTGEYVGIAVGLARDVERLKAMRAGLRERMAGSPLMDAERFTRHLESAYRQMWRSWCKKKP